jgi:uncharacterized integral membrane protein
MKRFIKALFLFAIGIVVVAYAVANRQPVHFIADPFISRDLAASFDVPLYLLLFAALLTGLIIGASSAWIAQRHWRRRARSGKREADLWKREAENLKRGLQASAKPPAAPAPTRPLQSYP